MFPSLSVVGEAEKAVEGPEAFADVLGPKQPWGNAAALVWVQPVLTQLSGPWRHPENLEDCRGMWAHPKAAPGTQTSPQEAEEIR